MVQALGSAATAATQAWGLLEHPSLDRSARPERAFAFGDFLFMPERQLLIRGDEAVRLGARAMDILTALVERDGEVVTKRELMIRAWPDTFVEEGNIKVNVAAIRRSLGLYHERHQFIATIVGRGYKFVVPVLRLRYSHNGDFG